MNLKRKCAAEALGTAWLVIGGCGAAALAGPSLGGVGIALAFGLSLMGGIYALGHISGGHFNPAVSLGLTAAGRFPRRNLPWYMVSQVSGALIGAGFIRLMTIGMPGMDETLAHVANGYGDHSPGGFGIFAALLAESVFTFFFVLVVLGATDGRAPRGLPRWPSDLLWLRSTWSVSRSPISPSTRRAVQARRSGLAVGR